MDSFGFRNIKAEKANALLRYRRLQRLTALFRLLELCVFLMIVSRFTSHLPVVFKLSSDYFRGLSVAAVSPLFVFFMGNTIIIVLYLKSKGGDHSSNPINDLYDEYAKNCERNRSDFIYGVKKEKKQKGGELCSEVGCVVKEKKICRSRSENLKRQHHHHKEGSCRELRRSATERRQQRSVDDSEEKAEEGWCPEDEMSNEDLKRQHHHHKEGDCRELRRSATERRQQRSVDDSEEKAEEGWCPEDEMSNEEFRRTIEAFIARQQRALREDQDFSSDLSFENRN